VRGLLRRNRLIPLSELTLIDARKIGKIGAARVFYAQAVSLIGFLIKEHGSGKFSRLCRHLRDGKDLNGALRFTYPLDIRNIDDLERAWKKHLEEDK